MRFGIWNGAAALLLAAALGGCAAENINPVTGRVIYTPVTAETEAYYGQKANEQMLVDYGVYENPALSEYVDRVGQALAKNVVRKDVHYTFTVLDDDEINAFALPGGYVYITRGALNFCNSEAELAGILGHEIGHVDAFHFGHGGDHDMVKRLLAVLLLHSGKNNAEVAMAQKWAAGRTKSSAYSQQQEFEADALGIHYMTLAGYDPQGIVNAMRTEDAKAKLDDNGTKGNPLARDLMAMDQSHPDTPERETRAIAEAKTALVTQGATQGTTPGATASGASGGTPSATASGTPDATPGAGPQTDRDAYLAAIDGMTFGADPDDGTVEGHRLVNANLGFSFDVPDEFDLWPGHHGAFGVGHDAVMVFLTTEAYTGQSLATYVQSQMMPKMHVDDVRPLEIDGFRGATGTVSNDAFMIRLGAVHDSGNHLYRILFVAPREVFAQLDTQFIASLKSFHALEGAEAKPKSPLRLKIITVAPGDTVQTLAKRMAVKDDKLAWFRVLNGLGDSDAVKAGDRVKVVE